MGGDHRKITNREPGEHPAPGFSLIRGTTSCAWAVGRDVPAEVAGELDQLAATEPPITNFNDPPVHGDRYQSLVGAGTIGGGPAFAFPDEIEDRSGAVLVEDPTSIEEGFPDLVDEFEGRAPLAVVLDDGYAVSVCFCARRSDEAAEAGLHTLKSHRGRGFGGAVTSLWARAIRESGRIPLYSTSWNNAASLSVARKLELTVYASDWGVEAES